MTHTDILWICSFRTVWTLLIPGLATLYKVKAEVVDQDELGKHKHVRGFIGD